LTPHTHTHTHTQKERNDDVKCQGINIRGVKKYYEDFFSPVWTATACNHQSPNLTTFRAFFGLGKSLQVVSTYFGHPTREIMHYIFFFGKILIWYSRLGR